jgi:hypothetical protein
VKQEIIDIMMTTDPEGAFIFTEDEKASAKQLIIKPCLTAAELTHWQQTRDRLSEARKLKLAHWNNEEADVGTANTSSNGVKQTGDAA